MTIKLAAWGVIRPGGGRDKIKLLYASDEAFTNWLSKARDDNPDYRRSE